jgi:hypothetical protein
MTMTAVQVRAQTEQVISEPDPGVPERPRPPRRYPAAYKLRILEQYERLCVASEITIVVMGLVAHPWLMKMGWPGRRRSSLVPASPSDSVTWEPQAPWIVAASTRLRVFTGRLLQAICGGRRQGGSRPMEVLVGRCAALDVHKDTVVACVRVPGEDGGGRRQELRRFKATTTGLLTLADWLGSYGVTRVGMESTGCYWKPVVRHEVPCDRAEVQDLRQLAVAAAG